MYYSRKPLSHTGVGLTMPEHMVIPLTGRLPEPILMIPAETRDTFELKGDADESVVCHFVAAWQDSEKKLFDIGKELECRTKKYGNALLFSRDTGIVIPKSITQEYGIRMDNYVEIVMKKVIKGDQTIDVFPQREVFEHYPSGFDKVAMK